MTETVFSVRNIGWKLIAWFFIVGEYIRLDLMKPPSHVRNPYLSSGNAMRAKTRQRVPETVARVVKQPTNGWRTLKPRPNTLIRTIVVTNVAVEVVCHQVASSFTAEGVNWMGRQETLIKHPTPVEIATEPIDM